MDQLKALGLNAPSLFLPSLLLQCEVIWLMEGGRALSPAAWPALQASL